MQKLLKGRAGLKNCIDNWEEKNLAPMIVERTFFAKFLQFRIALVEEKYGASNDEKCDDPKNLRTKETRMTKSRILVEKSILSSTKGICKGDRRIILFQLPSSIRCFCKTSVRYGYDLRKSENSYRSSHLKFLQNMSCVALAVFSYFLSSVFSS